MKCKKCNKLLIWMSEIDSSNGEVKSLYICQNKKCKVKTIKIKLN